MIICENMRDAEQYESCWGNTTFEISRDEIMALLEGKILADPDPYEYGTFIKMEENK